MKWVAGTLFLLLLAPGCVQTEGTPGLQAFSASYTQAGATLDLAFAAASVPAPDGRTARMWELNETINGELTGRAYADDGGNVVWVVKPCYGIGVEQACSQDLWVLDGDHALPWGIGLQGHMSDPNYLTSRSGDRYTVMPGDYPVGTLQPGNYSFHSRDLAPFRMDFGAGKVWEQVHGASLPTEKFASFHFRPAALRLGAAAKETYFPGDGQPWLGGLSGRDAIDALRGNSARFSAQLSAGCIVAYGALGVSTDRGLDLPGVLSRHDVVVWDGAERRQWEFSVDRSILPDRVIVHGETRQPGEASCGHAGATRPLCSAETLAAKGISVMAKSSKVTEVYLAMSQDANESGNFRMAVIGTSGRTFDVPMMRLVMDAGRCMVTMAELPPGRFPRDMVPLGP